MVATEVGEHGDVEMTPDDTLQRQRVRRHLHHDGGHALVDELGEASLQIRRLGRGVRTGQGADHPGRSTGSLEDRGDQARRRRLAVRAGDPDERQGATRVAEERRRQVAHRNRRVGDDDLRKIDLDRVIDEQRTGTGGSGGTGEVVPVGLGPAQAAEQRVDRHPPRVEIDGGDRDGVVAVDGDPVQPRLLDHLAKHARHRSHPAAVLAAGVVRRRADPQLVHGDRRQRREQRTGSLAAEVVLVGRIGPVDRHQDRDLRVVGREVADEGRVVLLGSVVGLVVGVGRRVRLAGGVDRWCHRSLLRGTFVRRMNRRLQQRCSGLAGH